MQIDQITMLEVLSIRTGEGKLEIVNQLLLPHTTEYLEIKSIDDAFDAIKSMKVGVHAQNMQIGALLSSRPLLSRRSAVHPPSHPWRR